MCTFSSDCDAHPALGLAPETFDDRVGVGTRVEVEDLDSGVRSELRITDGQGQPLPYAVSAGSPIGRALMGNEPGAELTVDLPGNRTRRMRVLLVHRPEPT